MCPLFDEVEKEIFTPFPPERAEYNENTNITPCFKVNHPEYSSRPLPGPDQIICESGWISGSLAWT